MTKGKPAPKKKEYFVRTTSKRTGAIILIAFIIIVGLSISFFIYAKDFADKQKQYEDSWRQLSCPEMKSDYQKDPFVWKVVTMKDMKCIGLKDFNKELSKFTK